MLSKFRKYESKLIKFFERDIYTGFWDDNLYWSPNHPYKKLLGYLCASKKNICYNTLMSFASEGDHKDIIDSCISKGADFWCWGLEGATKGCNRNLVDFFRSKGGRWYWAMKVAAKKGYIDILQYYISKSYKIQQGNIYWKCLMEGLTEGNRKNFTQYFENIFGN